MADVITDTYPLHIGLVQHGDAKIYNVVAPSEVEQGDPYNIEYDCKNEGVVTDLIFGYVKNDSDEIIFEGTEWEESIPSGQELHKIAMMPPINEPLDVTIVVGYRKP